MHQLYKLALLVVLLLGHVSTMVAQTPIKLKEISAALTDVAHLGESILFRANDGLTGNELWKTDGTEAGTMLVKDIFPGTRTTSSDPNLFFTFKGMVFFQARSASGPLKLFKSDGTANGTQQVTNKLNPSINLYLEYKDKLYFISNNLQFWVTDGTDAGTSLVTTLPGRVDGWVLMKDKIYFKLRGSDDYLYESDGTPVGTKEVKRFAFSASSNIVALNNTLYFTADDGTYGAEPWKSDGTTAGTVMIGNFGSAGAGISPKNFTVLGNKVVFTVPTGTDVAEFWQTDGTEAGTKRVVMDPKGRTFIVQDIWPNVGGKVYVLGYFRTKDSYIEDAGIYVFKETDGNYTRAYLAVSEGSGLDVRVYRLEKDGLYMLSYTGSVPEQKIDISRLSPNSDSSAVLTSLDRLKYIGINFDLLEFINKGMVISGLGMGLSYIPFCTHTAKIKAPNGASFCPGSSVNIIAEGTGTTGGYTYTWRQGGTNAGTNATLTVNKAGTYVVDVADSKGCVVSTSVEITQVPNLLVAISGASSFCTGQTTPLSASVSGGSGSYSYQWRLNGGVITGETAGRLVANTAGVYSVSVVDANGCAGASSNLTITQKPSPNATITTSTGSTTFLTGNNLTLSVLTAIGQTYQWLKDGQPIAGATNNTYLVNQPGSYAVTVTRDGCSATSTATAIALVLALEPGPTGVGLTISPNPVEDVCMIKLLLDKAAPAQVLLLDTNGKPIRQWTLVRTTKSHEMELSLADVPPGLYIIQIAVNEKRASSKLIKY